MKTFTIRGLAKHIEDLTGLECFIMERPRIDEPHIVLEFLGNESHYADNTVHLYQVELRAIYGYRDPLEFNKINKIMLQNFNAVASTGYDQDGEWLMIDYDFYAWLKDV